jgi:hypothetical protein
MMMSPKYPEFKKSCNEKGILAEPPPLPKKLKSFKNNHIFRLSELKAKKNIFAQSENGNRL